MDVFLELEHWAALADVSAREAAMLLCQRNPRKTSFEEAKTIMFPDLPDGHLERLDRRLSDYAAQNPRSCRSLWDWYSIAQEMKIKLAPEAVLFMGHVAKRMESDSTPTSAPVVDSASITPDWKVSKPQRYKGYTAPLHRLLAAAHRNGNPCPTARDVVEAWRNNAPAEIAKVLPDGFDYYDAKGNTKTADLEAIRKAIGRMTIAR